MPTLQFKGKNAIWNHHLSIPYHTLEEDKKLHFQPEKGVGNLIIEGDNLLALKALLPRYAGKVHCIYIDPPYNTNSTTWVYNDNVNSPMIKEWLGSVVGKDDLTRHDKWLCMIAPRLKVLYELLSDNGAIFISIDHHEVYHLRMLLNEIFGEENFIMDIVWRNGRTAAAHFTNEHEYIICFAKDKSCFPLFEFNGNDDVSDRAIKKPTVKNPISEIEFPAGIDFESEDAVFPDEFGEVETVKVTKGILKAKNRKLAAPVTLAAAWSMKDMIIDWLAGEDVIDQKGQYIKRFFFKKNGVLQYEKEKGTIHPKSIINDYTYKQGTNELSLLFNQTVFDFPKPVHLVKYLLSLFTTEGSVILDSFAGSGTTMQAVMELNAEDGKSRRCIMVQMTEETEVEPKKNICKDITRERVKRAIEKNGYESGFHYLRVGQAIDPESILSGNLPSYNDFAKYVFYLCTGKHHPDETKIKEKDFFVAKEGSLSIYLIYTNMMADLSKLALNLSIAEKMRQKHPNDRLVVYAPSCFLDEEYLRDSGIEFVSIPYGLFTKSGN